MCSFFHIFLRFPLIIPPLTSRQPSHAPRHVGYFPSLRSQSLEPSGSHAVELILMAALARCKTIPYTPPVSHTGTTDGTARGPRSPRFPYLRSASTIWTIARPTAGRTWRRAPRASPPRRDPTGRCRSAACDARRADHRADQRADHHADHRADRGQPASAHRRRSGRRAPGAVARRRPGASRPRGRGGHAAASGRAAANASASANGRADRAGAAHSGDATATAAVQPAAARPVVASPAATAAAPAVFAARRGAAAPPARRAGGLFQVLIGSSYWSPSPTR